MNTRRSKSKTLPIVIASIAMSFSPPAICQDGMQFSYNPRSGAISARGYIDAGAGNRFEQFVDLNKVPSDSVVYLHSPGGLLLEGMRIGKSIRQHKLRTEVSAEGSGTAECYSACSLAFLGGTIRTVLSGSRYGVHQFRNPQAPTSARAAASQVAEAQVASARIVQYMIEMGVDPELFARSALIAPKDVGLLSPEMLRKLKVTTDPSARLRWSIDELDGNVYLRGEREENGRRQSVAIGCKGGALFAFGYFDKRDLGTALGSDTLLLGDEKISISSQRAQQRWESDYLVVTYNLSRSYWPKLRTASSVGITVQSPNARGYAGVERLPFETGTGQRDLFVRNCMTNATRS